MLRFFFFSFFWRVYIKHNKSTLFKWLQADHKQIYFIFISTILMMLDEEWKQIIWNWIWRINIYMSSIILLVGNKNVNKIGPSNLAIVKIGRNCRIIWFISLRSIYLLWNSNQNFETEFITFCCRGSLKYNLPFIIYISFKWIAI